MSKKRAFVRYSKQGKIVPGSLILTAGSYPNGPSTWKEVPADLCCDGGCTPPLFTPIEVRVHTGEFGPCAEPYETNTWYIYQTSLFGIPIVKLVVDTNLPNPTPADARQYYLPSIEKVIIIATEGLIANVGDCS